LPFIFAAKPLAVKAPSAFYSFFGEIWLAKVA
jgi:hypothetical protein